MKAVIKLDVPEWQIGQDATIYFPDTMVKKSKCEEDHIVMCKDCIKRNKQGCPLVCDDSWYTKTPPDDFFCAFGERKKK